MPGHGQTIDDRPKEPATALGVANVQSVWSRCAYHKSLQFLVVLNGHLSKWSSVVLVGSLSCAHPMRTLGVD
jgi:hypothetical protein